MVEICESYEVLRDNEGSGAVCGGLIDVLVVPESDERSKERLPKLKWLPELVKAGLIMALVGACVMAAGDILLRKSRYAEGGVIGVLKSSFLR